MNMHFQEGDVVKLKKDSFVKDNIYPQYENTVFVISNIGSTMIQLSTGHDKIHVFFEDLELVPNNIDDLPKGIEGKKDLNTKPHLAYLDPHLEYEMGMGMRYGASKHGWNNHRTMDASASQHILDSLKRHLNAYLRGEEIDPETGVNHLACLMNNCNFLYRLNRIHGYDNILMEIYGATK